MNQDTKRKQSFLLRLPITMREHAMETAHQEGTSLNHFISLAVAEKLSRMEREKTALHASAGVLRAPLREGHGFHGAR